MNHQALSRDLQTRILDSHRPESKPGRLFPGVFPKSLVGRHLFSRCNGQRGGTPVRPRGNHFCSLFYLGRYLTGLAELRCKPKRGLPTLLGSGETWDGLGASYLSSGYAPGYVR